MWIKVENLADSWQTATLKSCNELHAYEFVCLYIVLFRMLDL